MAWARLASDAEEVDASSGDVVGMMELPDAIDCRSSRRGSCSTASIFAVMRQDGGRRAGLGRVVVVGSSNEV